MFRGAAAYSYDAADNPTLLAGGVDQTFNVLNQVCGSGNGSLSSYSETCGTQAEATAFAYDGKDERTSDVPVSGPATCYTYDQERRLTQIQTGTGNSCSTPTTLGTYTYDGDGLRTSKTIGSSTTNFSWDVAGILPLLLKETGSASTYYLYGPSGVPVEMIQGATPFYLHHDQLGSVRCITDASGTSDGSTAGCITRYAYDAYGKTSETHVSGSVSSSLRYNSQYQDSESGLYYLRARYYDPDTSQFLTRDPATAATRSPYAYVDGNPISATDPTGKCGLWGNDTCWGDAAGAVGDTVTHLCVRNPLSDGWWGSNVSDGCQSALSGEQGTKVAAATVGCVAGGEAICAAGAAGGASNLAVSALTGGPDPVDAFTNGALGGELGYFCSGCGGALNNGLDSYDTGGSFEDIASRSLTGALSGWCGAKIGNFYAGDGPVPKAAGTIIGADVVDLIIHQGSRSIGGHG